MWCPRLSDDDPALLLAVLALALLGVPYDLVARHGMNPFHVAVLAHEHAHLLRAIVVLTLDVHFIQEVGMLFDDHAMVIGGVALFSIALDHLLDPDLLDVLSLRRLAISRYHRTTHGQHEAQGCDQREPDRLGISFSWHPDESPFFLYSRPCRAAPALPSQSV